MIRHFIGPVVAASIGIWSAQAASSAREAARRPPRGLRLAIGVSTHSWVPWKAVKLSRTFINKSHTALRFNPVADLILFADGLEIQFPSGEIAQIVVSDLGHRTSDAAGEEDPDDYETLAPQGRYRITLRGKIAKGSIWDLLREREVHYYVLWFGSVGIELPKEPCDLKIRAVWNPHVPGRSFYDLKGPRSWELVSEWTIVRWNP
jgi:hypothetical protein